MPDFLFQRRVPKAKQSFDQTTCDALHLDNNLRQLFSDFTLPRLLVEPPPWRHLLKRSVSKDTPKIRAILVGALMLR
jgi:hypothetical protein